MKNNLNLSIPTPCSEKWENFTPASNGRHCDSCQKTVVDFTKMSDRAILEFLKNKAAHTCGRFRSDQLKEYVHPAQIDIKPGFTLVRAGVVSLLLLLINKQSFAESIPAKLAIETVQRRDYTGEVGRPSDGQIVKGIIKDETGLGLPGVNVMLKGTNEGTVTAADGSFEFPRKLSEGDVLIFSFIGYASQEYVIQEKNEKTVDLAMELEISLEMDMIVMGTVSVNEVYIPKKGLSGLWEKIVHPFSR